MPGAAFDAFGLRRDAGNWTYDLSFNQISSLKDFIARATRSRSSWTAQAWST